MSRRPLWPKRVSHKRSPGWPSMAGWEHLFSLEHFDSQEKVSLLIEMLPHFTSGPLIRCPVNWLRLSVLSFHLSSDSHLLHLLLVTSRHPDPRPPEDCCAPLLCSPHISILNSPDYIQDQIVYSRLTEGRKTKLKTRHQLWELPGQDPPHMYCRIHLPCPQSKCPMWNLHGSKSSESWRKEESQLHSHLQSQLCLQEKQNLKMCRFTSNEDYFFLTARSWNFTPHCLQCFLLRVGFWIFI